MKNKCATKSLRQLQKRAMITDKSIKKEEMKKQKGTYTQLNAARWNVKAEEKIWFNHS